MVVVVPTSAAFSRRLTIARDSLVPVNVGVVSLVIPSLDEDPVSLAAASTGAEGAAGARMSIVTVSVEDAEERFPAVSSARTVIAYTPSASALEVTVVVALLPISTPAAYSLMLAAPKGMSLVNVGVVSLVISSVIDRPLSLDEFRFGVIGVEGAV